MTFKKLAHFLEDDFQKLANLSKMARKRPYGISDSRVQNISIACFSIHLQTNSPTRITSGKIVLFQTNHNAS